MIPTSIDGTDITGATIDGTDVQEITVDGDVVFSAGPPAGLNMYLINPGFNSPSGVVFQFSVNNPFTLDNPTNTNNTVSSGLSDARGVYMRQDGTMLFVASKIDNEIQRFTLSTPFDISTANQDQTLSEDNAYGIYISSDGLHLLTSDDPNGNIIKYDLSTPFDLNSASRQGQETAFGRANNLMYVDNGNKLLVTHDRDKQSIFDLPTQYDIFNRTNQITRNVGFDERGTFMTDDGTKYFIVEGGGSGRIEEYTCNTPYDITNTTFVQTFSHEEVVDVYFA
jgi:hypothetical protein